MACHAAGKCPLFAASDLPKLMACLQTALYDGKKALDAVALLACL